KREVVRRDVDLRQVRLVLEHRREDRLRERRVEARRHDEQVRDTRYRDVGRGVVGRLRDLDGEVEWAVLVRHLLHVVGEVAYLDLRRGREIEDRRHRKTAAEEERVDLAVA